MGPVVDVTIRCYRSILATDFAAYGLPSSLRKPRAGAAIREEGGGPSQSLNNFGHSIRKPFVPLL